MNVRLAFLAPGLAAVAGIALWAGADNEPFPHPLHQDLFPTECAACHGGIASGDPGGAFTVIQEDCARCHNGDLLDAVPWSGPAPRASNLRFDHRLHVTENEIECAACHQVPGTDASMAVGPAPPEACLPCHEAPQHLSTEAECATCHRPLTEAVGLSAERIAAFPKFPGHDDPEFLHRHGAEARTDLARCATCHAREDCEACHLNAKSVAPIQALGRDSRVEARAAKIEPRWPMPESHRAKDWASAHGKSARSDPQKCASCHAQPSCRSCHGSADLAAVNALPPGPGGAGAGRLRPPGHAPGFALAHGTAAASGSLDCMACHAQSACEDCHQGATRPGFHPPNFMTRHAAEAYARDTDCASCHSTEVFCRDCHRQVGLSVGKSQTASYHDAEPFWLLTHGRAARQGLETCASCHQQTDCLRCHSARTGWRVSPHGPDFNADGLGDRALVMCALCHFSDPGR